MQHKRKIQKQDENEQKREEKKIIEMEPHDTKSESFWNLSFVAFSLHSTSLFVPFFIIRLLSS